ncbi:MAG: hypothetical protein C0483_09730 [Pirellula sp.]|nr:hypothetical protein [Pirellula sp.]
MIFLNTPHCELVVMPNIAGFIRTRNREYPPHPPFGHCSTELTAGLLPPGENEAQAGRAHGIFHRRKCCALNRPNAHNGTLGVRVEALTNKGAHYTFPLVRTGHCTLRGLTSIDDTTIGDICRKRRTRSADKPMGVRNGMRGRAHRKTRTERGAH